MISEIEGCFGYKMIESSNDGVGRIFDLKSCIGRVDFNVGCCDEISVLVCELVFSAHLISFFWDIGKLVIVFIFVFHGHFWV